jgi:hypothetical protein
MSSGLGFDLGHTDHARLAKRDAHVAIAAQIYTLPILF